MMMKNLEKIILEAIYGICCDDGKEITDIKEFICREFSNGGICDDIVLLSFKIDKIIKCLREKRCLDVEYFMGDEPHLITTSKYEKLLGYSMEM